MSPLRFRFDELLREASILRAIAHNYLDASTLWVLDNLREQIEHIWEALPEGTKTLTLRPLLTKISPGHYEPIGRTGPMHIYAKISGIWEVRPIGQRSKKDKGRQNRLLEFCGIASTRIELYAQGVETIPISMWRMELGDSLSPGCYFHVQVLGEEGAPFPKEVSVPRLPSLFITPMAVVEYVIGELFQDRWAQAVAEENANVLSWRSLQTARFVRLFNWQINCLKGAINTPWMTLKAAKPPGELFLE